MPGARMLRIVAMMFIDPRTEEIPRKAKIAARSRRFDGFLSHEDDPPMFLKGDEPLELSRGQPIESGVDQLLDDVEVRVCHPGRPLGRLAQAATQ